jgi:hypothetical protein
VAISEGTFVNNVKGHCQIHKGGVFDRAAGEEMVSQAGIG